MSEQTMKKTKKKESKTTEAVITEIALREFIRLLAEKTIEQIIEQEPTKKEQEGAEETKTRAKKQLDDVTYQNPIQFIERPYQVDYAKLYAHMGNTHISIQQPEEETYKLQETAHQEEGAMAQAQAASMVKRIIRSRALQQILEATEEEKEQFRYWRLFSENKVLRRLYEASSGFRVEKHYHMRTHQKAEML
jgi:hypothetical protein